MNIKYRIKLKNTRIVGPFEINQVGELYLKGRLEGDEQCQEFPAGDWRPIQEFKLLSELIIKIISGEVQEKDLVSKSETVINMQVETKKKSEKKIESPSKPQDKNFEEFQFSINEPPKVDYEKLEEKYNSKTESEPIDTPAQEEDFEATRIINRASLDLEEKTVIINSQSLKQDELSLDKKSDEVIEEVIAEELIDTEEKTQFVNLNEITPDLVAEVKEIESELDIIKEEKAIKSNSKKQKIKTDPEDSNDSKKNMKPVVALAFIVILWVVLFPEKEKPKELKPLAVKVSFPIATPVKDIIKSKSYLSKGISFYQKGTYADRVRAASNFNKSLSFKFRNNNALGFLILTYAELYDDASNKRKAAKTIFKLVEIGKSKVLKDINVAMGTAIFYSKIQKYYTAVNVIENYLRLSKPSIKLYSTYLDILIQAGELSKARPVFEKLSKIKKVSKSAYLQMSRFQEMNENHEEAQTLLVKAGKSYPSSVPLLLEFAKYKLRAEDYKSFEETLKVIKEVAAEQSPVYMSKFYEYMGILSAIKKNNKLATIFFKKALKLKDSDELRSKLASAELGGSEQVEQLILESKIIDLMRKSKIEIRDRNWNKAFSYAIDATDLNKSYIPSQLLLANIQRKRGYYESAINTLEQLRKKYANNSKITYQLAMTYIDSYKLADAKQIISISSRTKFESTAEYASLLARYYNKSNQLIQTLRWFTESLNRNPLNDEDYFLIAKVFLKHRKYKKGKSMLNKAMNLDPLNVDYRSLYAKVLYELDSADTAIGYLRKELEKHSDNPKLLGDIAIYYYRNGQMTEFERYKKKIEALNTRDTSFYEFLINSAKLNEKYEDVILYSKELIKVNPGDLETRIVMGEYLLKKGFYKEALKMFESIKARLRDYPKTNYFIAKTYLQMKNYKEAIKSAKTEIKDNPAIHYGYVVMGQTLRKQKKYQEARKFLEKAVSLNGKSVEALMGLGWIKRKQNYLEPARELYLRALKEDSDIPEIHRQLGFIYKDIGQTVLAIESLRLYLNMDPTAKDKRQIEILIKQLK